MRKVIFCKASPFLADQVGEMSHPFSEYIQWGKLAPLADLPRSGVMDVVRGGEGLYTMHVKRRMERIGRARTNWALEKGSLLVVHGTDSLSMLDTLHDPERPRFSDLSPNISFHTPSCNKPGQRLGATLDRSRPFVGCTRNISLVPGEGGCLLVEKNKAL